jgi:hypothetical protein
MFVVELDFVHLEPSAPLGLVPETILKCAACVLLSDEELYRFRVVKLGERIQTHRPARIRLVAKQTCQGSRCRCFGAVPKRSLTRESAINKRRQRIFV